MSSEKKHTVIDGQWLGDIALQNLGAFEGVIALAIANNISITEDLQSGQEIILTDIVSTPMSQYYNKRGLKPGTIRTAVYEGETPIEPPDGIGYWFIGVDFIAS